jgi:hypothetical protein
LSFSSNSLSYEALLSLKVLIEQESVPSRKFLITTYLFNGLRKYSSAHLNPRQFNVIQVNLRNLIKSMHKKFKEDHYKTFMNAFIHIWKHPDFTFYGEAVLIMNSLNEHHYRTLLDILHKMILSKTPHKNIFKLSLAIICYPPRYVPIEKVKVTNEVLFKNILLNCISSKSDVSNFAVESLADILLSPDLEKEYIKQPIKVVLNCDHEQNLNVPVLLRGLQSLMNKKWSSRSRNKNLFVVAVSIMLFAEEEYPETYREVLEILCEEASPFDLKPYLPLLSETYIKMTTKNYKFSAFQILKIIFKMSLHPMASSTEYVKYLYTSMVYPNVCKGVMTKSEIFIDLIISDDFNYVEFFQKCQTLGFIKIEHISKLMNNLSSINESNLKLLCAITHLTEYKELSIIANHINDHFMMICNNSDLNYLFYIYNKIVKNNSMRSFEVSRSNEIMTCFIKHHLLRQTLRWNCVANAFALLKTLEDFTNLEEDFEQLKQQYDRKLALTLQDRGSFLPLLYYSQLVIFSRLMPSEDNLIAMTDFLKLCSTVAHRSSPEFNPKIWIGCLLLYTNICIVKTSLVEACLDFLHNGLNSSVTAVKLASINMTFDLCNMVTHNFEDIINYMFKQLVYGDAVFKKTCLLKIDRLIRDDYLKLDLKQFLIFVSILGDCNISLRDYGKQLLSESFFTSNTLVIARYFVPFIVHINGYRKHSSYIISSNGYELVQLVSKNVLNRRKIYNLLFNSLPMKSRFSIIHILTIHVLENLMKGTIELAEGFLNMIKDSIYIFKLMTPSSNEDESNENYNKKVVANISKYLLQRTEFTEKPSHTEYHKEITKATETLLKLLFFNDSNNIQKYIRASIFDAIIHWTNFLMLDLIYLLHTERNKELRHYYSKFDEFFKKNGQNMISAEETLESESVLSTHVVSIGNLLFSVTEEYIPEFEND